MDAVTPRQLTLYDLTRDELLEFARRVTPFLRQRDLLRARWDVACRKSADADQRAIEASESVSRSFEAYNAGGPEADLSELQEAYEAAKAERETAFAAQRRAWAAQERAYAALSACKG